MNRPATNATTLTWRGGGGFEASQGGFAIAIESGPDRSSLSPMEAFLSSVAACMAVDVVEILGKMRRPPSSYSVFCEGWRADVPPRRYTRIRLIHRLAGEGLDEASVRRAVELSRSTYCSAMASIDPAIEVENLVEISPPA